MRRFFSFLIALVIAVCVGIFVARVPGFVMIQVGGTSIAISLWLSVLGMIVIAIILTWLWRILRLLFKVIK